MKKKKPSILCLFFLFGVLILPGYLHFFFFLYVYLYVLILHGVNTISGAYTVFGLCFLFYHSSLRFVPQTIFGMVLGIFGLTFFSFVFSLDGT